jgi:hypothetical protein
MIQLIILIYKFVTLNYLYQMFVGLICTMKWNNSYEISLNVRSLGSLKSHMLPNLKYKIQFHHPLETIVTFFSQKHNQ